MSKITQFARRASRLPGKILCRKPSLATRDKKASTTFARTAFVAAVRQDLDMSPLRLRFLRSRVIPALTHWGCLYIAAPRLFPGRTILILMSRVPIDQIMGMPTSERVELAQQIWESVFDHPEELPLTNAQRDELESRWIAFQQNPNEGEPWADVRKSLLKE